MNTLLLICIGLTLVAIGFLFKGSRAQACLGNAAGSTATFLFGGGWGRRLSNFSGRILNDDLVESLMNSLFTGGILYGICWWLSSEGAQHPILSAVLFGTFGWGFGIPTMVDDLLEEQFGRHSTAHVVIGGMSCLVVFLQLALAFVTFFSATVTLAAVGLAFAIVFAVIMLLYFVMAANGHF